MNAAVISALAVAFNVLSRDPSDNSQVCRAIFQATFDIRFNHKQHVLSSVQHMHALFPISLAAALWPYYEHHERFCITARMFRVSFAFVLCRIR